MKFRSFVLAMILVAVGAVSCQARIPAAVEKAGKATHSITMRTILQGSGCSATSIAPQALLTASHCELGTDKFVIDGKFPAKVVKIIRDDYDHTIILYDGPAMTDFVKLDRKVLGQQGDDIFVFGNPGPLHNILRKGMFAGFMPPQAEDIFTALFEGGTEGARVQAVYDFNGFHGDSGAAVFNEAGQIIGVVSAAQPLKQKDDDWMTVFMVGWAPSFTKEQIETAENFLKVKK